MLRYFIAANLWVLFTLILLLGKAPLPIFDNHQALFGIMLIEPMPYWGAVGVGIVAAAACIFAWLTTLKRAA